MNCWWLEKQNAWLLPQIGNAVQFKATVHIGTYTSPRLILFHSHAHTYCIEKQFHHSKGRVTPQLGVHMGYEEGMTIGRILVGGDPAGDSLEIFYEGVQGT